MADTANMKLRFNNTYKKGHLTYIAFPNNGKYLGVCLEFDLSVEGDTLEEAKDKIQDYARLWHKNVVKNRLSEELLNKPADKKFWNIYNKILEAEKQKALFSKSPVKVASKLSATSHEASPYPQSFSFV